MTLEQALGRRWCFHEERAGETAQVPLVWLAQIEAGVRQLKEAAQSLPGLQSDLSHERVRADAADEELARTLSTLCEVQEQLDEARLLAGQDDEQGGRGDEESALHVPQDATNPGSYEPFVAS